MNLILDLVVVTIIVLFIISGARKGFIKSSGRLASVIVSFLCASRLSKPLAALFSEKVFGESFGDTFIKEVAKLMNIAAPNADAAYKTVNLAEILQNAPEFVVELIEKYGVDIDTINQNIQNAASGALEAANREIVNGIVMPAVHAFSNALSFIVVFALAMLICGLIIYIVDMVFKLPILHTMNTSLGVVVGALSGFLCICLLCIVFNFVEPYLITVNSSWIGENIIENTLIFRWFYHNNIIVALLQWVQSAF